MPSKSEVVSFGIDSITISAVLVNEVISNSLPVFGVASTVSSSMVVTLLVSPGNKPTAKFKEDMDVRVTKLK